MRSVDATATQKKRQKKQTSRKKLPFSPCPSQRVLDLSCAPGVKDCMIEISVEQRKQNSQMNHEISSGLHGYEILLESNKVACQPLYTANNQGP